MPLDDRTDAGRPGADSPRGGDLTMAAAKGSKRTAARTVSGAMI